MAYQNIIRCERCREAVWCEILNPYICHNYSPEINSISCVENVIITTPGLTPEEVS
jgi:hypothetical protein